MFKKFKKFAAVLLAFTMLMGLAVTANAATTQTTTEDTNVFKLEATASGATVSYQAITVEGGGTDSTGKPWPDSTVYNYYISLPKNSDTSTVEIKTTFPSEYSLYIGDATSAVKTGYTGKVNLSSTKTFELVDKKENTVRTFQVAAGVAGEVVPTVYVRVDVVNALTWLKTNTNANTTNAVNALKDKVNTTPYKMNDEGEMIAFVPVNGLATGSTAMDALKAACNTLGLETAGSDYYVSGIGVSGKLLSEKATTGYSGWLYLDKPVGEPSFNMANYGAASYSLNGGEQFVWCFANGWDANQYSYLNTPKTSN